MPSSVLNNRYWSRWCLTSPFLTWMMGYIQCTLSMLAGKHWTGGSHQSAGRKHWESEGPWHAWGTGFLGETSGSLGKRKGKSSTWDKIISCKSKGWALTDRISHTQNSLRCWLGELAVCSCSDNMIALTRVYKEVITPFKAVFVKVSLTYYVLFCVPFLPSKKDRLRNWRNFSRKTVRVL